MVLGAFRPVLGLARHSLSLYPPPEIVPLDLDIRCNVKFVKLASSVSIFSRVCITVNTLTAELRFYAILSQKSALFNEDSNVRTMISCLRQSTHELTTFTSRSFTKILDTDI